MLNLIKTLTRLGDRQHIVRDKAAIELEDFEFDSDTAEVATSVLNVMFSSTRWEDRFGAVLGCTVLSSKARSFTSEYLLKTVLEEKVPQLIFDSEFRVRIQVGAFLKAALATADVETAFTQFERFKTILVENIS